MTDAIGASVIRFVLDEVKQTQRTHATTSGAGGAAAVFAEAHGNALASLCAEDLQLLQAASELVDKRAVKKVTAVPSKRVFYRVESLNRYHQQQNQQTTSAYSQPFDANAMSGNGPSYYNCFDHYCSCSGFHLATIKCPSAMCKHIVALLLADATDQCVPMTIQDSDFAKMLCPELVE